MSLLGNSKVIAIGICKLQQATGESSEVVFLVTDVEGRVQLESAKIKNKWKDFPGITVDKNPRANPRWFDVWCRQIPHATKQISPCAVTTEACKLSAYEPQLLSPCAAVPEALKSRASAPWEKPQQWEVHVLQWRVAHHSEDPAQPKINK